MNIEEARQFVTDLEGVLSDAGMSALVEHEHALRAATASRGTHRDDARPASRGADEPPPPDEQASILRRIGVLLDLAEAAIQTRHDVEQEVLAMAHLMASERLIMHPGVTIDYQRRQAADSTHPDSTHADSTHDETTRAGAAWEPGGADPSRWRRIAAQDQTGPQGRGLGPLRSIRRELGLERGEHPITVEGRTDWATSWRRDHG